MVIICPGCKANFAIDDAHIDSQGVKLRCCRCKAVFKIIRKKRVAAGRTAAAVGDRPSQVVKFVVAHESQAFCEAVKRVLANEPFLVYDSNDGAEAMAIIERVKPHAVLLDVALPTMYGFEICEAMRRNPQLAETKILLLAAIYDKRRYRRDPASLYGADEVIEKHRIPDELISKVYALVGNTFASTPAVCEAKELLPEPTVAGEADWLAPPDEAPVPSWEAASPISAAEAVPPADWLETTADAGLPVADATVPGVAEPTGAVGQISSSPPMGADDLPVVEIEDEPEPFSAELASNFVNEVTLEAAPSPDIPSLAGPEVSDDLSADEVKARRLARIIISDIALYNPEKVARGVKEGSVHTILADELAEGKALYVQRVSAGIRDRTDYLGEALANLIAKKKTEYAV